MRNHLAFGMALLLGATSASISLAADAPAPAAKSQPAAPAKAAPTAADAKLTPVTEVEGLKEFSMPNGLRVVLFPDASKPRVTVNITYFVGSRHEGNGEAGMAHLLEHMQFKGTPTRPDIWKMLQQQGAQFNASTWYDRTNYHEILPASKENLDFALALEADRMINSNIAADALGKEFSVVRNEFERDENDPGSILVEQMFHTAFQWHGYGRTTIGNKSDIEKVPVPKLKEFYKRFYQPDNALLVVAGSFDEKTALDLIAKNFGGIPRPERKLVPTYTVEPSQEGEREVVLRRQGDQAIVGALYHSVASSDPLAPAIDATVESLVRKPSGILYKELVTKGLASEVDSGSYPMAEPGAFYFVAKVAKGKDPRAVANKLTSIVESLKPNQITDQDLKRYQADFSRSFDLSMTDSARVGIELSEFAAMGDWRLLFLNRDRVEKLKLADMQSAFKYMKPSNRTLGVFIPTKGTDLAPLAVKPDVVAMVKDYKGRQEIEAGEVFNPTFDNIMARTEYSKLANGLHIALMPKKSRGAPVTFNLELPIGTPETLKNKLVALHFLPHIMLRGTKKHDYEKLRDELALLKAGINGHSGWDIDDANQVTFSGTTVKGKLPEVLDLFAEILEQPSFDAKQFDLAKKEALSGLGESKDDPSEIASRAFLRTVANYPKTDIRYIPTIDEEIKMVEALTLNDVKAVYSQLGAGHGRLVMVGDFDKDAVKGQLSKLLGTWSSKVAFQPIRYESKDSGNQVQVYDTPDKKGAQVAMGQTFPFKESDSRFAASRMVGFIWGQGSTSRLINRLRQKDGLSYGAGGNLRADQKSDVGYISAFAICAPENVLKAVEDIRDEAKRYVAEGTNEQELKDAKTAYAETRRNSLTRDSFIIDLIDRNMELGRTLQFNKDLDQKIADLKLDDVNKAIKELVDPSKFFGIEAFDKKAAEKGKVSKGS